MARLQHRKLQMEVHRIDPACLGRRQAEVLHRGVASGDFLPQAVAHENPDDGRFHPAVEPDRNPDRYQVAVIEALRLPARLVEQANAQDPGVAVAPATVDVGESAHRQIFCGGSVRQRFRNLGGLLAGIGIPPLGQGRQVARGHLVGGASIPDPAVLQPDRRIAQVPDRRHVVGDQQDSLAVLPHPAKLANATLLEIDVPDRQRLVHQQNLRVEIDGDGKGQAHVHAAGIGLDGLVDEAADFGEALDLGHLPGNLLGAQAHDGGIQGGVFPAGELGVESGPKLEQCRHPPAQTYPARGRGHGSGDNLEQGALARPVFSHDPETGALPDLEADLLQRPEVPVVTAPAEDQLLQPGRGLGVDAVILGDVFNGDGIHGQFAGAGTRGSGPGRCRAGGGVEPGRPNSSEPERRLKP